MQSTIRQRRHLEYNSLRYTEPMKAGERVGDVVTTGRVSPGCRSGRASDLSIKRSRVRSPASARLRTTTLGKLFTPAVASTPTVFATTWSHSNGHLSPVLVGITVLLTSAAYTRQWFHVDLTSL